MKHVLIVACAAATALVFTACDDSKPAIQKKAESAMEKPAGVPSKVFKQIKGIEQKHGKDVQKQLDKL